MRSRVPGTVGRPSVWVSVHVSACLSIIRPQPRRAAGLLLGAVRAGDINRLRRGPSSNGAAARRSAANASSVAFTADVGSWTHRLVSQVLLARARAHRNESASVRRCLPGKYLTTTWWRRTAWRTSGDWELKRSWSVRSTTSVRSTSIDITRSLRTAVGTGPADPAAVGPVIWQTRIFTSTLWAVNFREREINPDRSFLKTHVENA